MSETVPTVNPTEAEAAHIDYKERPEDLHPAKWWRVEPDGKILCYLCPRYCKINDGLNGFCFIRVNRGGKLYSLGYANPAAVCVDPVEKKPLNHFLPGTTILSMGTAGCNMGCRFCQNWDISKNKFDQVSSTRVEPEDLPALAKQYNCASVAFTYNEPTIFGEYVIDAAKACRAAGIATVMVTNGYITDEARADIYPHIDAANVDLKAFTEEFYHKVTFSHLEPVQHNIVELQKMGVWVEVTTLLIPGLNDSPAEIEKECDWYLGAVGPDMPLHFTAFHPDFKMMDRPRTPASTLRMARDIALRKGLHHVYVGNVFDDEGQTTYCPGCRAPLIRRDWHAVLDNRMVGREDCPECGAKIAGHFDARSRKKSPGRRLPVFY
jgi:pyruvate formate lyase activating enzyme